MTFFLFILFSTLEYLSSLTLLLVLFRFNVKENVVKFIVSSLLLSLISNTLSQQNLETISPLVQLLVFVFLVYVILRVSIFNSIIMVFTIYFIFGLVQITLILILTHFGVFDKVEVYKFSGFITQATSSFYIFLFALIVYFKHGGFSFVDHSSSRRKKILLFNKSNRVFFIALVVAFIIFILLNILYNSSTHPSYLLNVVISFITLASLLYLAIKRDDNHV
jgi:hypothetical protein